MSTQSSPVRQFIQDATDAVARLDGVSTRHDKEIFALTLQRGQKDYEALLKRRESMPLLPEDAAVVDFLLDGIQARLKFIGKRI